MIEIPSFNELIEKSIISNWDKDALTDFKGATLQYHDVARKIEKLHIMFESSGVQRGDKIAGAVHHSRYFIGRYMAFFTVTCQLSAVA
jgi:long-chain acyl-CoA synthetase